MVKSTPALGAHLLRTNFALHWARLISVFCCTWFGGRGFADPGASEVGVLFLGSQVEKSG